MDSSYAPNLSLSLKWVGPTLLLRAVNARIQAGLPESLVRHTDTAGIRIEERRGEIVVHVTCSSRGVGNRLNWMPPVAGLLGIDSTLHSNADRVVGLIKKLNGLWLEWDPVHGMLPARPTLVRDVVGQHFNKTKRTNIQPSLSPKNSFSSITPTTDPSQHKLS